MRVPVVGLVLLLLASPACGPADEPVDEAVEEGAEATAGEATEEEATAEEATGGEGTVATADIAGCYRFEEPVGSEPLGLPWGVELLDEPLEGWPALEDAHLARTWLTPEQAADHPFGYWTQVEGDSVRTGYPGGGGFDLVLAPVGEEGGEVGGEPGDLEGRGRAVGDVVRPDEDPPGPPADRPVLARRVTCPE